MSRPENAPVISTPSGSIVFMIVFEMKPYLLDVCEHYIESTISASWEAINIHEIAHELPQYPAELNITSRSCGIVWHIGVTLTKGMTRLQSNSHESTWNWLYLCCSLFKKPDKDCGICIWPRSKIWTHHLRKWQNQYAQMIHGYMTHMYSVK